MRIHRSLTVLATAAGVLSLGATLLVGSAGAATVEPQQQRALADVWSPIQKQVYTGVGDSVIKVQRTKLPGIAKFTHTGESNFIVHTINLRGAVEDYLVNEIGSYQGTVAFNVDYYVNKGTAGLEIRADGAWKVVIKALARAPRWTDNPALGRGDAVLRLDPPVSRTGLHTLRARHWGNSNFIVHSLIDGQVDDYLINEIGAYRGQVRLPNRTQYITVHADGSWRFART